MKKRIIGLILVVAMAVLALSGCAFNYARANLSRFATFDGGFKDAIWNLSIKDGSFGRDPEKRWDKVEEAIIAELLSKASADNKHYEGKPGQYDYLAYCYYAVYEPVDEEGNKTGVKHILFTSKMDESAIKPSSKIQVIQLGNPSLDGFNKLVSDAILGLEGDTVPFYSTTVGTTILGKGDKVSVSYTKTQTNALEGVAPKVEKYQQVVTVGDGSELGDHLLGQNVNKEIGDVHVTEVPDSTKPDVKIEWDYSDIKVEKVLSSTPTVGEEDIIYITYTKKVEYKYEGEEEGVSVEIDGYKSAGNDMFTVSFTQGEVDLTSALAGKDGKFFEQLLGKEVGKVLKSDNKTYSEIKFDQEITATLKKDGEVFNTETKTVAVTYTDINIHWIVNSDAYGPAVEVTHKPTDLTGTDINGEKIEKLNEKELTYYIFPVYYTKVDDVVVSYDKENDKMTASGVNTETFLKDLLSIIVTTKTEAHEETEEEHNHDDYVKYVFATIQNGEFRNDAEGVKKSITELVKELSEANTALATAQKSHQTALETLLKAADGLASALNALENAEQDLAEAEEKLTAANTTLTEKEAALTAAQEALDALASDASEEAVNEATAARDAAKSAYETAKSEVTSATGNRDKAKTARDTAKTKYDSAKDAYDTEAQKFYGEKGVQVALDEAQTKVDTLVEQIAACTNGDKSLADALTTDYANYHYEKLETAYKNEINTNIATALVTLAQASITYDKLPKRAVRQAKKAILNTYKYAYYEGTSGTGDNAVSNFSKYDSFEAYLQAAVETEKKATAGSMSEDDVDAYIQEKAEKTVRELILIYTLADELDLELTRKEKKDYKKYYKDIESLIQQYGSGYGYIFSLIYGVDPSTQTLQDYLNAKQFDKVINYLLEVDENHEGLDVKYTHIGYDYIVDEKK